MENSKFIGVILAIIAFVWAAWSFFSGVRGLAKSGSEPLAESSQKGTLCETRVVFATEIYTVDHKINGIIPMGTEHYYFVMSEDGSSPMLIKASRKWFDKNFKADGTAKQPLIVKGEIKTHDPRNFDQLSEVNKKLRQIDKNVSVSQLVYMNSMYKTYYNMRIGIGFPALSAGAAMLKWIKSSCSGELSPGANKFLEIWTVAAALGTLALEFGSKAV